MAAGIMEPAAVEVEIQTSQLTEPSALKDRFARLSLINRSTEIDSSCCNRSTCSRWLQRNPAVGEKKRSGGKIAMLCKNSLKVEADEVPESLESKFSLFFLLDVTDHLLNFCKTIV